jgi:hypothetical protein
MKTLILSTLLVLTVSFSQAQEKYFTRTGHISFFSKAPLEDIEAHNKQATSILNVSNGELVFSVLMKGFEFEKALMQEHFNETYMESEKFPKAAFKGKIDNFSDIDFTKDGEYDVKVSGDLEIHGVSKPYTAGGTLVIKGKSIKADSKFNVKASEHGVKIPSGKADNISNSLEITVDMNYEPYGK